MDRYGFMADLVTVAADCVANTGTRGCPYDVFVSPGDPPADCSHIAAFWTGSAIRPGTNKCLITVEETFMVSLNMCCLKNVGEEFDPSLEDADAECFVRDFGALFECLVCNVQTALKPYVRNVQDVEVKVAEPEEGPQGGCIGGQIAISFERFHGCCEPASSV